MTGLARKGETEMLCPFCRSAKVKVFLKEGYRQAKFSRISAGAKTTFITVPDTYEILEGCPKCGKTKKEIQTAIETGITVERSHEDRIKRLQSLGIPTTLEAPVQKEKEE